MMDKEYESELGRRLLILKEYVEQGKIHFFPEVYDSIRDSLLAVRYGPDDEIDLSTVDSRVRALALGVTFDKDRQETKNAISLKDLQYRYFQILSINFGEYFKVMADKVLTPHDVATALSRNPEAVNQIMRGLPDFVSLIEEFWEIASEPAHVHVEDMNCLKAVFGGDLFPSAYRNIASTCSIYVNTIVLPDPFLRTREIWGENWPNDKKVYYLVKHALNILKYEELALAEVDPPIVVIVPDRAFLDDWYWKLLSGLGEADALLHLEKLFGKKFNTLEEAIEFVEPLNDPAEAIAAVTDKSRLLFDIESTKSHEEQLIHLICDFLAVHGFVHAGKALVMHSIGRMHQVNDIVLRSRYLGGSPLIDAPTSWRYFQWKLEYDAKRFNPDDLTDLHIVRGLQSAAAGEMAWLGNVPTPALIEMRKQGSIPELRQMLSAGVTELARAKPEDFRRTGDRVVGNIQNAFEEHKKKIRELTKKKWRFAGIDLSACLVYGSIEIAAACGVPLVSIINRLIDQLWEIPRFKEIPNKLKAIREEGKKLEGSPVGLLFRLAKQQ